MRVGVDDELRHGTTVASAGAAIGIRAQPTWNSDTSRARPASSTSYAGYRAQELLHQHDPLEPGDVRSDAHVHPVPEAEVPIHRACGVEALGVGELVLVAVGADQQQHDALTGAHRDARDLGVDEERAPDELQRELVTEHLLEGAGAAARDRATSAARCSGARHSS